MRIASTFQQEAIVSYCSVGIWQDTIVTRPAACVLATIDLLQMDRIKYGCAGHIKCAVVVCTGFVRLFAMSGAFASGAFLREVTRMASDYKCYPTTFGLLETFLHLKRSMSDNRNSKLTARLRIVLKQTRVIQSSI